MSEKKADAAVQEAGLLAERLEGLGDDILKKIVSRYLSGTLPGQ
jgi:dsRNA-specific ribonuclease